MLYLQIVGAFWYYLAVERESNCWHLACRSVKWCDPSYLYCGSEDLELFARWNNISREVTGKQCSLDDDNLLFNFGIYKQSLTSGVVSSHKFFPKLCYCLWWGLRNLR